MIEARTEDNKLFKTFFIKSPDYAMKIIPIWMILDDLGRKDNTKFYRQKWDEGDETVHIPEVIWYSF